MKCQSLFSGENKKNIISLFNCLISTQTGKALLPYYSMVTIIVPDKVPFLFQPKGISDFSIKMFEMYAVGIH